MSGLFNSAPSQRADTSGVTRKGHRIGKGPDPSSFLGFLMNTRAGFRDEGLSNARKYAVTKPAEYLENLIVGPRGREEAVFRTPPPKEPPTLEQARTAPPPAPVQPPVQFEPQPLPEVQPTAQFLQPLPQQAEAPPPDPFAGILEVVEKYLNPPKEEPDTTFMGNVLGIKKGAGFANFNNLLESPGAKWVRRGARAYAGTPYADSRQSEAALADRQDKASASEGQVTPRDAFGQLLGLASAKAQNQTSRQQSAMELLRTLGGLKQGERQLNTQERQLAMQEKGQTFAQLVTIVRLEREVQQLEQQAKEAELKGDFIVANTKRVEAVTKNAELESLIMSGQQPQQQQQPQGPRQVQTPAGAAIVTPLD